MKRVVFFHRGDLDGKCSAAIVYEHFKHDVELIGVNYGDDYEKVVFSKIDGDTIAVMVDFCMQPWGLMERLQKSCKHLIWIDHHNEAIKRYNSWAKWPENKIDGIRENGTAACVLTWMWFHNSERVPIAVELLGKYDVWRQKDVPDTLEFQMGMRLEETWPGKNDDLWRMLLTTELEKNAHVDGFGLRKIIDRGKIVLEYQNKQNLIHANSAAFVLKWRDMTWIAINEMFNNSTLLETYYDPDKHHGMLMFGWRGKQWHISMYTTREDVNVGEIASEIGKQLGTGGGGHKKAAGFQCHALPFDLNKDVFSISE